jgi:hypothetical protein
LLPAAASPGARLAIAHTGWKPTICFTRTGSTSGHLPLAERKQDLVKLCRKSIPSRTKLKGDVLFDHCVAGASGLMTG